MHSNEVREATLGIYIRRQAHAIFENQSAMILVYRLTLHERVMVTQPRKINTSGTSTNGWYHFNVLGPVNDWLDNPASNFGLEVMAADSNGNPLAIVNPTDPSDEPFVSTICSLYWRQTTQ